MSAREDTVGLDPERLPILSGRRQLVAWMVLAFLTRR
jgi:hypothetical protein